MSETICRFEIAFEETSPGGVTIIKIVEKFNPKVTVGFGVSHNFTGRVTTCDGENGMVLIDLLHFLQDTKPNIKWHIVT